MIDQAQISKIRDYLTNTSQWAVFFPASRNLDLLMASLAFANFLKIAFSDKNTKIYSPAFLISSKLTKELVKPEEIFSELGKENLIISFPYQAEKVEQVFSQIDEKRNQFIITVKPKKGLTPVDLKQIKLTQTGNGAELLFMFGVNQLSDLEQLYLDQENLFHDQRKFIVSINDFLPDFGNLDLDISGSSSFSESVFYLIKALTGLFEFDFSELLQKEQIANQLLFGIESKTEALQSKNVTASTFMAVAELMQNGAARLFENEKNSQKEIKTREKLAKPVVNLTAEIRRVKELGDKQKNNSHSQEKNKRKDLAK